jgi:hypothetical protein
MPGWNIQMRVPYVPLDMVVMVVWGEYGKDNSNQSNYQRKWNADPGVYGGEE